MRLLKNYKSFGGHTQFYEHTSEVTKTVMKFSVFLPPSPVKGCLIWLSGLTCTEENFMAKAGAQRDLAERGLMVLCPDTSPRGLALPQEHDHWDFGSGAGFYVDAITPGYRDHYLMRSYIADELYTWVQREYKVSDRIALCGHSMGGHGALVLGLQEPKKYRSLSAFAPIVNPSECPWGVKAFSGYLGHDKKDWQRYDACSLIKNGSAHPEPILIDQGSNDEFLQRELMTQRIVAAAHGQRQKIELRFNEGYDHSYYFIASFIKDHIAFHASRLV